MKDSDAKQFISIWTAANEVYNVNLTDAAVAMAFQILRVFDFNLVSEAINRYLSDPENGRFQPKPADIVKQIDSLHANDGRPSADEAWSIAVQSFDEYQTVVLNEEIAAALRNSSTIYRDGDKVGARMAFRSSYENKVKEARKKGTPVKWFPSLGLDPTARKDALEQAVIQGLLPASHANQLLPTPITQEGQKLIENLVGETRDDSGMLQIQKIAEVVREATKKGEE